MFRSCIGGAVTLRDAVEIYEKTPGMKSGMKQGQGVNELDRGLISFLIDRIEVFDGGRLWIKYRFAADFEDYLRAGW